MSGRRVVRKNPEWVYGNQQKPTELESKEKIEQSKGALRETLKVCVRGLGLR